MGQPAPAQPEQPQAKEPEAPVEKQPGLGETIRGWREAREAAKRAQDETSTLKQQLAKMTQELEAARTSGFEDDPVGYAKSRKWTPEQQLLYGQSLLYDLRPDKADPQFRIKMFEDKQARKEREAREAEEARKAQEAEASTRNLMEKFYTDTAHAVQSTPAGSYPGVEDWFGDDTESLMTSLMATARNVGAAATAAGQVADLSPAALMRTLEAEVTSRAAAILARKQKRTPAQAANAASPAKPATGGVQPIVTTSSKQMNSAGSAQPPAASEKERIQRAIAAAFKR